MGLPKNTEPRLTAEAFMAWYDQQPDGRRYELLDGRVVEMQGERTIHARVKFRTSKALDRQIAQRGLACEVFIDGMAVRVDDNTVFEPDAMVRCGAPLPDDLSLILDPMIVVEVASPATQRVDATQKLSGYFRNPSVMHYLILIPATKTILHHQRMPDGLIVMNQARDTGLLRLDPPGVEVDLAEVFGVG